MHDLSCPETGCNESLILVSAVVLTYQRQDLLSACLDSLQLALGQIDGGTEIVVVDNASPQNRATVQVAQSWPRARIVTLAENLGYAGGLNAGLDIARGEWILTIGDDATVEPAAVAAMLESGRSRADVGSVAAKMLFADCSHGDVINSAGIDVDRLGTAVDRLVGAPNAAAETETTEVFGTSGGAALYRRAMLDDLGGFDTSFGVYLEDVDVAWRARMAGWRCLFEPRAVVFHNHSATTGHRSEYKYFHVGRNRVRLLAKNATLSHLVRYAPLILLYDLAYITYALVADRTTAPIRGRIQGLRDWSRYRAQQPGRQPVELAPSLGLRAALGRNAAVWPRAGSGREGSHAVPAARRCVDLPP